MVAAVGKGMYMVWTKYNTMSAIDAQMGAVCELWLGCEPFGIMSPQTAQIVSFEEYCCANARTVI